jgi:hypothetical protein
VRVYSAPLEFLDLTKRDKRSPEDRLVATVVPIFRAAFDVCFKTLGGRLRG